MRPAGRTLFRSGKIPGREVYRKNQLAGAVAQAWLFSVIRLQDIQKKEREDRLCLSRLATAEKGGGASAHDSSVRNGHRLLHEVFRFQLFHQRVQEKGGMFSFRLQEKVPRTGLNFRRRGNHAM